LVESPLPVLRNFVDGAYVEPTDGKTSPVIDPCTGETYAHAPVSTDPDVAAAMDSAERGFATSGHSGHGKDLSMYGFEEYTRVKHVMSFLG
jgi:acyl-CoA reductase-like NAD-dependent aldehyde dehydrogenase